MRVRHNNGGITPQHNDDNPRVSPQETPAPRRQPEGDSPTLEAQPQRPRIDVTGAPRNEPVRPLALPRWARSFDFDRAVRGLRRILHEQGMNDADMAPGRTQALYLTDADLTFIRSTIGTTLIDPATGQTVMHPTEHRPIRMAVGGGPHGDDLEALARRYPRIPWDTLESSEEEWNDLDTLRHTAPIPQSVEAMRAQDVPGTKTFVLTARYTDEIAGAMNEWLRAHDVQGEGTIVTWADHQSRLLGLGDLEETPQRKAVTMAAMIRLFDPQGDQIRRVTFAEDSNSNMRAAMQLLPRMFPHIQFQFVDVVATGQDQFERRTIAQSGPQPGQLVGPDGQPLSAREIGEYASDDYVMAE